MSSGFVLWSFGSTKDGICKLEQPRGILDSFEISEGISRLEGWNPDASAAMDPSFPKDIGLADSLYGASFLIISGNIRRFLEGEDIPQLEYLPLKIIDHKGQIASNDYYILNPRAIVDCIDAEASSVLEDSLDPGTYCECEQLVLNEEVIPQEFPVFRLMHWPHVIMIKRELSEKMKSSGFTGIWFTEPAKYTGLF